MGHTFPGACTPFGWVQLLSLIHILRKSDLTGSISTAKGKDMLKAQSFNALDGLKGKVAGVKMCIRDRPEAVECTEIAE